MENKPKLPAHLQLILEDSKKVKEFENYVNEKASNKKLQEEIYKLPFEDITPKGYGPE